MKVLPDATVKETERLLREGVRQREIARRLPISRGSIWAIAHGRREVVTREEDIAASGPNKSARPGICPGCGNFVFPPCHICKSRREAKRNRRLAVRDLAGADEQEQPAIELEGEAARRYKELRREKGLGIGGLELGNRE